jgi:acyl-CoA thioesterase FadM
MNLLVRLFWVILKTWQARRRGILDASELKFRTWFHDLDLNLHMNNGRFLSLMDLGRFDLMARCGLLRTVFRHRWIPIVGAVHITYRRPLAPFQGFTLRTRVVAWDEKWFYIEQVFSVGDRLHAKALVKATLKERDGTVPSGRIVAMLGEDISSPILPSEWQAIVEADRSIKM